VLAAIATAMGKVAAAMATDFAADAGADVAAAGAGRAGPFDAVAGMELGAVPIATAFSLHAGLPMLIIRKSGRTHGTGKRIEGRDPRGLAVLVVEDVTTSGGSTLEAVRVLRDAGATVTHAVVVVDRAEGAAALLAKAGVRLQALVTAATLLARPEAKAALAALAAEAGA
jgi:orotate phosphoribosyltransferase